MNSWYLIEKVVLACKIKNINKQKTIVIHKSTLVRWWHRFFVICYQPCRSFATAIWCRHRRASPLLQLHQVAVVLQWALLLGYEVRDLEGILHFRLEARIHIVSDMDSFQNGRRLGRVTLVFLLPNACKMARTPRVGVKSRAAFSLKPNEELRRSAIWFNISKNNRRLQKKTQTQTSAWVFSKSWHTSRLR